MSASSSKTPNTAASTDLSASAVARGWLLLVLGSNDIEDNAMIGDFAGIMYHLQQDFGIKGDFLTAIDLKMYVTETSFKDIKFGRGNNTKIVYSQFHAQHREQPYRLVQLSEIKKAFQDWIAEIAGKAKAGEYVTVIIIAHGNKHGGIQLGTGWITKEEMKCLFEKFAPGVQVNVITNACFSGQVKNSIEQSAASHRYIQTAAAGHQKSWAAGSAGWASQDRSVSGRYRDFYFTEALIKSLLQISKTNKAPEKLKSEYNLGKHLITLKEGPAIKPPVGYKSDPQNYTDWLTTNMLCQILHLDFVSLNPSVTSLARAGARPAAQPSAERSSGTQTRPSSSRDPASGGMLEILKGEAAKVDGGYCTTHDQPLWTTIDHIATGRYPYTPQKLVDQFQKLYWRVTVQEVYFEALLLLHDKRLVDLSGLRSPVDLSGAVSPDMLAVSEGLMTFPYVESTQMSDYTAAFYSTPLDWLSIMIIRGAMIPSLKPIAELLHFAGVFGPWNARPGFVASPGENEVWDPEAYDEKFPQDIKIKRNPGCMLIKENTPSICGFLIPRLVQGRNDMEIRENASETFASAVRQFDRVWDDYRAQSC